MRVRHACVFSVIVTLALVAGGWAGEESSKKPPAAKPAPSAPAKPAQAAKPATHTVKKGPFKIEVSLSGVFESGKTAEVALRPEAWADLSVVEAVEPGTRVKAGDVILRLDLDKIDETITNLEADQPLADLAFKQAQQQLKLLEKSVPMDMAASVRSDRIAQEDLKRYMGIYKEFNQKAARLSNKSANDYLAYATEELNQLEKMYKADDLTEETEEIVLKRQRDAVDRAKFSVERAKLTMDETLKIELPRQEELLKATAERQALLLQSAKAGLPVLLDQKRLEFEKAKRSRQKAADQLAKLKRDREAMTVKAPMAGIVYYGKAVRGQWATSAAVAAKLQQGGKVAANEVFMTIVQPRPLLARLTVPEAELTLVRPGTTGTAKAKAMPDLDLAAKVKDVSIIPIAPGNFDARVTIKAAKKARAIMPGMACTIKLVPYSKDDAITVPSSAVFDDDDNADAHVVYVQKKDGKHEKRPVKLGRKSGDKTEILEGLAEGESILLAKPEK